MSDRRTCNVCSQRLTLRTIPVDAEAGAVGVVIEQAPYLACDRGHYRLSPSTRFDDDVVEQVRSGLPTGVASRLPWRDVRCTTCTSSLTMPARRTYRSVTVTGEDVAPFTVTLDVPLVRCTECGVDQLPPELADDVERAVRLALVRRGTTAG